MKRLKTLIIAAFIVVSFPLHAQPGEQLKLEELISELMKNNPDIQAAESRLLATQARPGQMRSLPDPVISFVSRNGNGNPLPFTELGEDPLSSVGLMWEQEFPFPGKLRLAGEMAQKEADAAKADTETVRRKIILRLKEAFFEYFQTHRSIQILADSMDLLKRFEEIARARYSVGEGIQQDVLRSQVEISIQEQRITSMKRERDSAAAEINQLLNRPVDAPLPDPAEITQTDFVVPVETLRTLATAQASQILSGQAMVEREERGLALAKKQYRPDFMTSVEYSNAPNFPDMWEIKLGLRIPIFYKRKQSYGVKEAVQNLTRAQKELRSLQQEVNFQIQNQYLQIQESQKLLKLYNQAVLPQTNLALESSLATYQVGKSDFLTTLSNFMMLLEYRMNYFEELARHEVAIARLESITGNASLHTNGGNHE